MQKYKMKKKKGLKNKKHLTMFHPHGFVTWQQSLLALLLQGKCLKLGGLALVI